MRLSVERRKQVFAFATLFIFVGAVVALLFYIDNWLFPTEVSSQFEDKKTFLEWYKKALESYQAAATLFSAWAASCIVVGYGLIRQLPSADKYFKVSVGLFATLFLLSIFDLYLSQAYFSYNTYVFSNDYPVFPSTIMRHVAVQKYVHLLMLVNVLMLAGISLIRKLQ